MVQTIKLKKIGGSVGAILPKEMLQRQQLAANDEVFVVETPEGILLTAVDPETTAALAAYAEGAKENRAAMAALASSAQNSASLSGSSGGLMGGCPF